MWEKSPSNKQPEIILFWKCMQKNANLECFSRSICTIKYNVKELNHLLEIFDWNIDTSAINHDLHQLILKDDESASVYTWSHVLDKLKWSHPLRLSEGCSTLSHMTSFMPHWTQSSSRSSITTSVFLKEWQVSLQCRHTAEIWASLDPLWRCWSRRARRDCLVSPTLVAAHLWDPHGIP